MAKKFPLTDAGAEAPRPMSSEQHKYFASLVSHTLRFERVQRSWPCGRLTRSEGAQDGGKQLGSAKRRVYSTGLAQKQRRREDAAEFVVRRSRLRGRVGRCVGRLRAG